MHLTANSIFIIDLFIRFHYIIEIGTDLPNWFQIQHRMRNVQTRQEFSICFVVVVVALYSQLPVSVPGQSATQFIFNALELKINCWNRHMCIAPATSNHNLCDLNCRSNTRIEYEIDFWYIDQGWRLRSGYKKIKKCWINLLSLDFHAIHSIQFGHSICERLLLFLLLFQLFLFYQFNSFQLIVNSRLISVWIGIRSHATRMLAIGAGQRQMQQTKILIHFNKRKTKKNTHIHNKCIPIFIWMSLSIIYIQSTVHGHHVPGYRIVFALTWRVVCYIFKFFKQTTQNRHEREPIFFHFKLKIGRVMWLRFELSASNSVIISMHRWIYFTQLFGIRYRFIYAWLFYGLAHIHLG